MSCPYSGNRARLASSPPSPSLTCTQSVLAMAPEFVVRLAENIDATATSVSFTVPGTIPPVGRSIYFVAGESNTVCHVVCLPLKIHARSSRFCKQSQPSLHDHRALSHREVSATSMWTWTLYGQYIAADFRAGCYVFVDTSVTVAINCGLIH